MILNIFWHCFRRGISRSYLQIRQLWAKWVKHVGEYLAYFTNKNVRLELAQANKTQMIFLELIEA